MKNEIKGMGAAVSAYTIFGLSYLFSKKALGHVEPVLLLASRFTITFIVLNFLALFRVGKLNLRGKPIGKAVILGFLQPILYFIFENYGIKYTTTTFSGLVSAISPVLGIIMGVLLLHERATKKQWLFAAVSVAGVMIISLSNATGGGTGTIIGGLCLITAYLLGALYLVLARTLSEDFTSFELTYVMFGLGFIFFAAFVLVQNGSGAFSQVCEAFTHPDFVYSVLYLGVLSSVVAYLLINYSLANLPVARASSFNSVSTVVSVVSGVLIMHDPFNVVMLMAAILILVGVWGVNHFSEKAE